MSKPREIQAVAQDHVLKEAIVYYVARRCTVRSLDSFLKPRRMHPPGIALSHLSMDGARSMLHVAPPPPNYYHLHFGQPAAELDRELPHANAARTARSSAPPAPVSVYIYDI